MEEQPQENVSIDSGMSIEHNFRLVFTNYVVADYTFRISDSHGSPDSICDDQPSNAGRNFIEYNLHFYRTAAESSQSSEQESNYSDSEQSDYGSNEQPRYEDNGTSIMDEQWG